MGKVPQLAQERWDEIAGSSWHEAPVFLVSRDEAFCMTSPHGSQNRTNLTSYKESLFFSLPWLIGTVVCQIDHYMLVTCEHWSFSHVVTKDVPKHKRKHRNSLLLASQSGHIQCSPKERSSCCWAFLQKTWLISGHEFVAGRFDGHAWSLAKPCQTQ